MAAGTIITRHNPMTTRQLTALAASDDEAYRLPAVLLAQVDASSRRVEDSLSSTGSGGGSELTRSLLLR